MNLDCILNVLFVIKIAKLCEKYWPQINIHNACNIETFKNSIKRYYEIHAIPLIELLIDI